MNSNNSYHNQVKKKKGKRNETKRAEGRRKPGNTAFPAEFTAIVVCRERK